MVNAILAKRVNHIVTKGDNPAWPKGSKSRGFSNYLYNAIEKIGFINELHGDAIECAWQNNDIEFLRTQWEDLALDQIRALQAIINGMLRVTPTKSSNEVQLSLIHI